MLSMQASGMGISQSWGKTFIHYGMHMLGFIVHSTNIGLCYHNFVEMKLCENHG